MDKLDVSSEPYYELFEKAETLFSLIPQFVSPAYPKLHFHNIVKDLSYMNIHYGYAFRKLDKDEELDFDLPNCSIVRSSFENTIRLMWISRDFDLFKCECRSWGFFKKAYSNTTQILREVSETDITPEKFQEETEDSFNHFTNYEVFGKKVEVHNVPNTKKALKDLGSEKWYVLYRNMSSQTHSSPEQLYSDAFFGEDFGEWRMQAKAQRKTEIYRMMSWSTFNALATYLQLFTPSALQEAGVSFRQSWETANEYYSKRFFEIVDQ